MSDHIELVKRLRSGDFYQREGFEKAADALEAQAKRIKELTESCAAWKGIQEGTARLLKEKEARIAELEAADAAAWSGDISKAPKDKMILADLGGGRVVLAYYSNWHYMLNPGWQSGEMGYVANEQIQKWRLAPTPPKELTK